MYVINMLFPSQILGFYDIIQMNDTKYIVFGKGKLGIYSEYKDDTLDKMRRKFITMVIEQATKDVTDISIDALPIEGADDFIRQILSSGNIDIEIKPEKGEITYIQFKGTLDNIKISVQFNKGLVNNNLKFKNKVALVLAFLSVLALSEPVSYMKNLAQSYAYLLNYLLENLSRVENVKYTSETIELSKLYMLAVGLVLSYKQIASFKPKFGPNMSLYSGVFIFGRKSTSVIAAVIYPCDTEEPSGVTVKRQEARGKTMSVLNEHVHDKRLLNYSQLRELVLEHMKKKYNNIEDLEDLLIKFNVFILNIKPRIPRNIRKVAEDIVESDLLDIKHTLNRVPAVDLNVLSYALGKFFDYKNADKYKILITKVDHCQPDFRNLRLNVYPNPIGFVLDELFGEGGKIKTPDEAIKEGKRLFGIRESGEKMPPQAKNILAYIARIYFAYAIKLAVRSGNEDIIKQVIEQLCGYMKLHKLSRGKREESKQRKKQRSKEVEIDAESLEEEEGIL